ncbi:MAG TPA: NADH-quinone oxidoreductase subunit C [Planctomycetota bacterium]|nr:NADH-quinone oxidoreductase subunit C [Planctomycetota bacterium]
MPIELSNLVKEAREKFGSDVYGYTEFRQQYTLRIKRDANIKILKWLKEDPALKFEMLVDVTCVDALRLPEDMLAEYPERFAVVYNLNSLANNTRLRVKAFVPEDDCEIDSVAGLWYGANWGEREVFDMFGIVFRGHPDLKRILMPENYEGHPLRKDYPLKGRGERDNFPKYEEIPDA